MHVLAVTLSCIWDLKPVCAALHIDWTVQSYGRVVGSSQCWMQTKPGFRCCSVPSLPRDPEQVTPGLKLGFLLGKMGKFYPLHRYGKQLSSLNSVMVPRGIVPPSVVGENGQWFVSHWFAALSSLPGVAGQSACLEASQMRSSNRSSWKAGTPG